MDNDIIIEVVPSSEEKAKVFDFDQAIFDLNSQIDLLTGNADALDYMVAAASGLICGIMDALWVGEFDLSKGRKTASEKTDAFVKKMAHLLGCKDDDVNGCVKYLEDRFPIPADGNTPDFGGGLQHHLRDFAHHPTIVGLAFSLLTQFTEKSYGTDVNDRFIVVNVPKKSKIFIGKDPVNKIINGTVIWFFHLVSDMAGSSSTAGISGGTGIPGPILSLAKELSAIPVFSKLKVEEKPISLFLSKLFNGTLLAKHDENGKIIKDTVLKLDLRGELGIAEEVGKQALPVIANEAIVRAFYFIRRLGTEIKKAEISSLSDFEMINWSTVLPVNSPTVTRMLTVASGVFTTVDIAEAVITKKYWVAINYVGVGRFAIAIGGEIAWALKRQDIKALREMYQTLKRNTFQAEDNRIYGRIESDMRADKLGLTLEETEILYNLEYQKTKNDIDKVKLPVGSEKVAALKQEWLDEWSQYMAAGFPAFVGIEDAELRWYSMDELSERIQQMNPSATWYKLALLEAMLFEPYFPLGTETDKKGKEIPSKKYDTLTKPLRGAPVVGFSERQGDKFLQSVFADPFNLPGFIARLRKCHSKAIRELNEVLKTTVTAVSISAVIIIAVVITAGAFAPQIAVALVGSKFAGLSSAALTNACLAYIGGGAVAAGGAGMAGGTITIVGGSAILGTGLGAGAGGITAAVSLGGKKTTIMQSAKLMVSVREIFLNEEKDTEYSTTVYEQYVRSIAEIEKDLVELRLKEAVAPKEEKKELKAKIKNTEESVDAMKIAMKSMNKFISSFKVGLGQEQ